MHALPSHGLRIPFACVGSVYRHACLLVAMCVCPHLCRCCVLLSRLCVCVRQLALFGLGAMRDERLHRTFRQDRVKFRLPENDAEVRDFDGVP